MEVNVLLGKTLASVAWSGDQGGLLFKTADGESFLMYHQQDCCESVDLEDTAGDLNDRFPYHDGRGINQ